MYEIVLVIQLVICVALIGLVLLQRSEGGALGMGGGGGGSLMSGRGAADALARFTGFAGAGFLATSLLLTVIAGASQSQINRSVLDTAPVTQTTPRPAPTPTPTAPDPLESSAPEAAETQLASASGPVAPVTVAPPPAAAAARAAPVVSAPQQPRAAAAVQPASARPATAQAAAATRPATSAQPATRQPAATTPAPIPTESSEAGGEPETVRRERAGPDQ